MCMITYVPAGIEIPVEGIKNSAKYNRDGHGWAVASKNGLFVGKSMKIDDAVEAAVACREREGKDSVLLFHSRFGTHGVMGEYNVHPFPVDEDGLTVMAHNGVLPSQFLPKKDDPRSDTRIFVERIGSYINNERGVPSRSGGKQLGKMIGANKLVFLSVKSGVPKARLVNSHMGSWVKGVWFSNDGYKRGTYTSNHSYGGSGWSWSKYDEQRRNGKSIAEASRAAQTGASCSTSPYAGESSDSWDDFFGEVDSWWLRKEMEASNAEKYEFKCPRCGEDEQVDWVACYCPTCYYCLDCQEDIDQCFCYTPASAKKSTGGSIYDRDEQDLVEEIVVEDPPLNESVVEAIGEAWTAQERAIANTAEPNWEGLVIGMTEQQKDAWLQMASRNNATQQSPIAQEIIRQRVEEAKRQLGLSDEPLALPSGEMKSIG